MEKIKENKVKDGEKCKGCGLPNYQGLCPYCRGNEEEFKKMWGEKG